MADELDTPDSKNFADEIHRVIEREPGVFTLTMGETDQSYFRETIQARHPQERKAPLRTHVNIRAAQRALRSKLVALTDGANAQAKMAILRAKSDTIIKALMLAIIPVEREEDAFEIFETLNARGLRLAPPDLLLNYLMRVANPKSDRKQIRSLWTEMLERMKTRDISKFLRAFWVSKYGDLKGNLFVALKAKIETEGTKSLQFARDCFAECGKYNDIMNYDPQVIGEEAAPLVKVLIHRLKTQPAMALLLASFDPKVSQSEFAQVCRYALVFVTRYSIFAGLGGEGLENILYRLAREVRGIVENTENGKSAKIAKQVKTALMNEPPTNKIVTANLHELVLSGDDSIYVMHRIATHMQTSTKELAMGEANLEHIYPSNPKPNEWGGPRGQEILDPYLWHIGNLTWLGVRLNRDGARNEEYPVKQKKYSDASELEITTQIAKQYDEWNETNILDRASKLGKTVLEIWNFDNPSRV